MSDEKLRQLERQSATDPTAAARLPVETCRVHGHDIVDSTADMSFTPSAVPGRMRWTYPLRVRLCERCGWLELYADVGSKAYVMSASPAPDPVEDQGACDADADADQADATGHSPSHCR